MPKVRQKVKHIAQNALILEGVGSIFILSSLLIFNLDWVQNKKVFT